MTETPQAPVAAGERVLELDVLRGVALFGVLLMNLVGFARNDMMATSAQLLALPTAAMDGLSNALLTWLVEAKAYTLFAFLFGLGFWLQMKRQESRGADFERIYVRRLAVLFVFGVAHCLFLWAWDILHLYALAGLVLFAMRRLGERLMLYLGIGLALFVIPVYEAVTEFTSLAEWHGQPSPFTDEAILARQAASESGSYGELFREMLPLSGADYLLSGLFIAWFGWSLGRFLLGAWVGRRGWFQDVPSHLAGFRRVMRIALPAGLIISGLGQLMFVHAGGRWLQDWERWQFAGRVVRQLATPVLALGYLCAIVCALHSVRGRRLLAPFADAGRMALTNYVAQSFLIGFVLFGFGPGLALAGRIGTTAVTAIAMVAFAAQVAASRWWMARYRFGPLEWLWRAATYGNWPKLRAG